jgi:hypothetical protein
MKSGLAIMHEKESEKEASFLTDCVVMMTMKKKKKTK